MSSEEIVRYEWLFVLVMVLGLGFRELYALRRDNRKAREQEAAESAAAHGAGPESSEPRASPANESATNPARAGDADDTSAGGAA